MGFPTCWVKGATPLENHKSSQEGTVRTYSIRPPAGDFREDSKKYDFALNRVLSGSRNDSMTGHLSPFNCYSLALRNNSHSLFAGRGEAGLWPAQSSHFCLCSDMTVAWFPFVLAHHSHRVASPNNVGICEIVYGQQNMETSL